MMRHVLKSKRFKIVAVYDISKKRVHSVARTMGCIAADSASSLINDPDVNCVFIFSPNHLHAKHAIMAARAAKHVFLEKPIANTVREGKKIVAACRATGVTLAIAHNVRYYSIFKMAKKVIDEGMLGDIVYIESHRSRPIGPAITNSSWRFYKKLCNGGPLMQMGIHLLDTVRFLVGFKDLNIQVQSERRFLETENKESFSVNIKIPSGPFVHLFTSYVLPEAFYVNVFGTKGNLFADPFNGLYFQGKSAFQRKKISYSKKSAEVAEIRAFYDALVGNRSFKNPTTEEALDNVRIVEEVVRRVAKG